jgi:hypothetical protein
MARASSSLLLLAVASVLLLLHVQTATAAAAAAPGDNLSIVTVRCFLSPEGYVQNIAYKLAEWPAGEGDYT